VPVGHNIFGRVMGYGLPVQDENADRRRGHRATDRVKHPNVIVTTACGALRSQNIFHIHVWRISADNPSMSVNVGVLGLQTFDTSSYNLVISGVRSNAVSSLLLFEGGGRGGVCRYCYVI